MDGREPSRAASPASPMTSSFYDATTTIDDLTTAIADLSRIPSPDPTTATLICCCGKDDCHSFKSWVDLRTKLNQRLVLSAGTFGPYFVSTDENVEATRGWAGPPSKTRSLCTSKRGTIFFVLFMHVGIDFNLQRQLRDAEKYPESEPNRSESITENLQRDLDDLTKEKVHLEKVSFYL